MYYPKSQIQENLHTNGGELKPFNSNDEYKGYYFKTSNGEFFTGKSPSDKPNIPLDFIGEELPITNPNSNNLNSKRRNAFQSPESEPLPDNYFIIEDSYYSAKSIPTNRGEAPRLPQQSKPIPNQDDYKIGEFERYFVKKANENKFIEINEDEYNLFEVQNSKVQFNLYIPIKLTWAITGDRTEVFNRNKSISFLYETRDKLHGFSLSFQNKFDKYFKPS